jgi:hypothetical protein
MEIEIFRSSIFFKSSWIAVIFHIFILQTERILEQLFWFLDVRLQDSYCLLVDSFIYLLIRSEVRQISNEQMIKNNMLRIIVFQTVHDSEVYYVVKFINV